MAFFRNGVSRKSLIQTPATPGTFRAVLADPPWPYEDRKGPTMKRCRRWKQIGVGAHYKTLTLEQLKGMSVKQWVAADCHLYLWTTNSFIVEAHEVARCWGFKPKTLITWGKTKLESIGTPSMKTGNYFRSATEHLLFAVRGRLKLQGPACPTLFLHPRLPHSVKPTYFYHLVEKCSPGPYLELFARRHREGWHRFGDQVDSTVEILIPGVK